MLEHQADSLYFGPVKIVKFFIGVLLLPLCVAVSLSLCDMVVCAQSSDTGWFLPPTGLALLIGFGIWVFLFFTMPKPVKSYVLAHELTHALWGLLMGAKIFDVKVRKNTGSVTLSKTNFLILLAPYFFPFYTMLFIIAYCIMSFFFDLAPYNLWWLGMIGLTWGFHFTFTVATLLEHQSDITENGYMFSMTMIYLLNVVGICLCIIAVTDADLKDLAISLLNHIESASLSFWETATAMFQYVADRVHP